MNYRVYFHKRDGNDPVVWSVDEGTPASEMHVQWFSLIGICASSITDLAAKPGEPSGWLRLDDVRAEFGNGGVVFSPAVERG